MRRTVGPLRNAASSGTGWVSFGGAMALKPLGPASPGSVRRASPDYLKALRSAELASWNKEMPAEALGQPLRRAQAELQRQRGSESGLLGLLALLAALAVTMGLSESFRLPAYWADFVRFVQQVVG